ncbi:unnamed protein product [Pleuronectes platessa]|uniref:Uncharacterized protein n=1 Tax=Pleuronectes platessa TaxID=8262 RepID=A0A9N7V3W3_PLEPL|nr:unnamed protein product [Pleuronectes platessa]
MRNERRLIPWWWEFWPVFKNPKSTADCYSARGPGPPRSTRGLFLLTVDRSRLLLPSSICPPPSTLLHLPSSIYPPPSTLLPITHLPLPSSIYPPPSTLLPLPTSFCPPPSTHLPLTHLHLPSSLYPPPSALLPLPTSLSAPSFLFARLLRVVIT